MSETSPIEQLNIAALPHLITFSLVSQYSQKNTANNSPFLLFFLVESHNVSTKFANAFTCIAEKKLWTFNPCPNFPRFSGFMLFVLPMEVLGVSCRWMEYFVIIPYYFNHIWMKVPINFQGYSCMTWGFTIYA